MAEAQKKTNLDYVNEIWNIADYVRDVISRADYNKAVLPFALLLTDCQSCLNQQELLYAMQRRTRKRTGDVNLRTIASIQAKHFIRHPVQTEQSWCW
ncbi:MAG: hypothetical protein V8S27_02165 [Lachnospiraceae bacterium]